VVLVKNNDIGFSSASFYFAEESNRSTQNHRLSGNQPLCVCVWLCAGGCASEGLLTQFTEPSLGDRCHRITSVVYSHDSAEVLVSYSSQYIYLFGLKVTNICCFLGTLQHACKAATFIYLCVYYLFIIMPAGRNTNTMQKMHKQTKNLKYKKTRRC